jgi:tellurite methyltransferase
MAVCLGQVQNFISPPKLQNLASNVSLWAMRRDLVNSDNQPARWLVDNIDLLTPGRVLDVAMGAGRNAVYLAKLGFQVEGVDIAVEAVAKARRLAEKGGVSLTARVGDLEGSYIISPDTYDDIICFYYLHRPLIEQIKQGLKPGGIIVYETYLTDQSQWGKPQNPDHLLCHNELLAMFRDYRLLRYREGVIEPRKALASLVAQKVKEDKAESC